MDDQLTIFWILFCSALVFLMQVGFLCLESGMTRTKNSINVAIKNLADFCLSTLVFWAGGFAFMFGSSQFGWIGSDHFLMDFYEGGPLTSAFFLFQVMFCGAAVTIISGVVAERLKFGAYLIVALIVSGLLYPIAGHWSWAGLGGGEGSGWLSDLGFVDFAGSTVVHSVGGWAGLALVIIVGPRIGRFQSDDRASLIRPSSLPIATLGTLLLFIGWLGFNGGSTLAFDRSVPLILVNTVIAGSAGALAAGGLAYAVRQRLEVEQFMNGALGGLVAVTANCFAVTTPFAALIGAIGGMIVVFLGQYLEHLEIDDAVGAIPVHLGAGVWGTLATGLYGDLDTLGTDLTRLEQIGVQLLGIFVYGAWTFFLAYLLFWIVNYLYRFRVSPEHELIGLNASEHGVQLEFEALEQAISQAEHDSHSEPARNSSGNAVFPGRATMRSETLLDE
jgi:Amt family ammonium transporter